MPRRNVVWAVERSDGFQRWTGIVDICRSRLEALAYAHGKAREVTENTDVDFGTTEQVHPVRAPDEPPVMHPCEYVVTRDCIWYIHRVLL